MQFINPTELNDPSGYGFTNIVTVPPEATLADIAGQGSGTTDDGSYPESFSEQVDRAFANLRTALTAIGASPETVVKITVLSVDHTDDKLHIISAARNAFWPEQKPASTLVLVPRLATSGMLFEIDAVAVIANQ
ncbi:MAG: Rid family hydrolase [Cyanobacteria bacterium P01_D01_bin.115]